MKSNYEARARRNLTRRMPVVVRVDGRAFHAYTKGMPSPFSRDLMDSMVASACDVFKEMQGCKMAYVQSDEASFVLTDYDTINTQAWFDYCQNKIESVSAALMSVAFYKSMLRLAGRDDAVTFDARAFNIPQSEVANYFLWRAKDWHRNSVQMLARSAFSHSQLMNKNIREVTAMLRKAGHNWLALPDNAKYGTFIVGSGCSMQTHHVEASYRNIATLWSSACAIIAS